MIKRQLSVTEVNRFVKTLITTNSVLKSLEIKGEVSNFKRQASGHLYFSLKDAGARIGCVMFRSDAAHLDFEPEDGMHVICKGRVDVFEQAGQYQIYVRTMQPAGTGDLYRDFETLKRTLETLGYFDMSAKKKIPEAVEAIGVVTSPTGAAIHDIISVCHRRDPHLEIVLAPAQVQGKEAGGSIASSIRQLDQLDQIDVIIVGRGGGSIEDLWAFNECAVADAIYHAKTPIVSAVGHETDFTIADFVADLRVPTPSAAAETVTWDQHAVRYQLDGLQGLLQQEIQQVIANHREAVDRTARLLLAHNPEAMVDSWRMVIDHFQERLVQGMRQQFAQSRQTLDSCRIKLVAFNPRHALKRGFAWVHTESGELVRSAEQAKTAGNLRLSFADGDVKVKVEQ
ncbi:exodeoxyribonuclease VII large subunit [Pseudoramibacter faecis]|uniref:exodeoxyribonuclease VII large subunit n=1 Tax=Pseudoramibacter faecis TaxID=3108534 RepID=UPI002E786359|nr:exodeoxyribonuclease VII large subunit [Pseudoramibacter sp. HA2172]